MARSGLLALGIVFAAGCAAGQPNAGQESATGTVALQTEVVAQRYSAYTPERAEREGYKRDAFCLDASSFGLPAQRGAMGFHATNESLLRGPIDAERPQALLFDALGHVVGVEYEIVADAVRQPPDLFGRSFSKLPPHAGVQHEHYALHMWFVENPEGRFADFNPRLSCPQGSTPGPRGPGETPPPGEHGEGH